MERAELARKEGRENAAEELASPFSAFFQKNILLLKNSLKMLENVSKIF